MTFSTQNEPSPAIDLSGVTKRYATQTAVDNLTLRIEPGTVYGLLGPNGAGKSTTIRMLLGMIRPTSGCARVLGLEVFSNASTIKCQVGYMPELHYPYRWMRVGEALRFCRALYPTWSDQRCALLLDQFGLDQRKKVRHLSKGMTAKLALILALAHEPKLLILDEPTSGLDPLVREELMDGVLQSLCEGERTVLFSSHSLADVQRLADRVGIMCEGKLLVDRPIDELLGRTKRIRAVLRDGRLPRQSPPGTIREQVQRREWLLTVSDVSPGMIDELREFNPVENVDVCDLTLEEVFKDYIRGQQACV